MDRSFLKQDNSLVNTSEVLTLFNPDHTLAVKAYIEFMEKEQDVNETEKFQKHRSGIVGDKKFRRFIQHQKVA